MNELGHIRSYHEINKQMKVEETKTPHPSLDSVTLREEDLNLHKNCINTSNNKIQVHYHCLK